MRRNLHIDMSHSVVTNCIASNILSISINTDAGACIGVAYTIHMHIEIVQCLLPSVRLNTLNVYHWNRFYYNLRFQYAICNDSKCARCTISAIFAYILKLLCLRPHREGGIIKWAAVSVCLSVRPTVCPVTPVPQHNSRTDRPIGSPNSAGWKRIKQLNREPI